MFFKKLILKKINLTKSIKLLKRSNKTSCSSIKHLGEHFDLQTNYLKANEFIDSFKLFNSFISEQEETSLIKQVDQLMKKRKYEDSHWDYAIKQYREIEYNNWTKENNEIIKKIYNFVFYDKLNRIIPRVHILDLAKNGHIKPHVDSIKFCGETITGLSLNSNAVMRLKSTEDENFIINILLKKRSLYIMQDFSRYKFTHEILGEEESYFKNQKIDRDRRISLMFRCLPKI